MLTTEKEVKRIERNGKKITKILSYRLQVTDSAIFIASSLSNLVNNLAEEIYKTQFKNERGNKNAKHIE